MKELLDFLFSNIISVPLILLSWIVPKEKGLILLTSERGIKFKDNPKYFYLYLIREEKLNPFWVTKSRRTYNRLRAQNMPVSYIYSFKHFFLVLRAEFIVCDTTRDGVLYDSLFWYLGRFRNIMTWHGAGVKKIGLQGDKYRRGKFSPRAKIVYYIQKRRYRKYALILASSEADKQRKVESFRNKNVKILGFPRNDYLLQKARTKKEKRCRKVLYAPTFRESKRAPNPFSVGFLEESNRIFKDNSIKFLIKRHPYDTRPFLDKKYSHIKDITYKAPDIQDILPSTDILITDYSSVATDFVLLSRPLIFYIYDKNWYISHCRSFYYDFFSTAPGPFIENENELCNYIVANQWFFAKEYQQRYKDFTDKFHKYKDNNSSERLFKELMKSNED